MPKPKPTTNPNPDICAVSAFAIVRYKLPDDEIQLRVAGLSWRCVLLILLFFYERITEQPI